MTSPSVLLGQLNALRPRLADAAVRGTNVHYAIGNALNLTREAMVRELDSETARNVQTFTAPVASSEGSPPYPVKADAALAMCDQLIGLLAPPIQSAKVDRKATAGPINRITPETSTVFIVHGHDEANVLRLQRLIKERFGLKPIVLMDEPSAGETVIEKFERVASHSAFCIVLMTPDDQVGMAGNSRGQARPNAIFELGWFYGRLGRSRVCIVLKRGTSIHSDLAGIVRLEFIERVDETVMELERELAQAGLLKID